LLAASWAFKAFLSSGFLTLEIFCLIAIILAESLADLFPSTFTVTILTTYFARASAAFALLSFAKIAAFLAGGAVRILYLSFVTFYCALSCFFNAAFLAGSVAEWM
jgi:hypothetical protein